MHRQPKTEKCTQVCAIKSENPSALLLTLNSVCGDAPGLVWENLRTFSWALSATLELAPWNSVTSIHVSIRRSASLFRVAPEASLVGLNDNVLPLWMDIEGVSFSLEQYDL